MWGINAPSWRLLRPGYGIRTPRAADVVITRSGGWEIAAYDTVYMRKGVALVRIRG
jgi:hypothetical protein